MTEEQKNSIKEKLLHDIRSGEVRMTPRLYFTLKVLALAITALAVLVITVFIFNFIYFSIRISSHDALLGFGTRGFEAFLHFFPWPLLLIDIALVIALQALLRHFRLGYKVPILYLAAGLVVAAGALGFLLDRTSLNDLLMDRSDRLPSPIGGFYDRAGRPLQRENGVCRCIIVAMNGSTLTVEDTRFGTSTLTVLLPQNNPHATSSALQVGDTVFIAGEEDNGVIQAFGVRKVMPGEGRVRRPQSVIK